LPPSRQTRNRFPIGLVGHLGGIRTVARDAKKKGVESGRSGSLWGGDRGFESSSLQRGVRNEPVPQRPQNYGAKRFTSDKQNWGYQLRFGLFEISDVDLTRLTSM